SASSRRSTFPTRRSTASWRRSKARSRRFPAGSDDPARASLPPIESACFWLATAAPRRGGPDDRPTGEVRAGGLVVGGGFTGLWSALFLKELDPSLDVAIVEQGRVAFGGSGRNGGIVGETLDHSHELAAAHFGRDEARELARLGRDNLDELETFLAERGID